MIPITATLSSNIPPLLRNYNLPIAHSTTQTGMSSADYLELENMPRATSPASSTHEALSNVSSQPLHRVDAKEVEGETDQWTGRMDTERFLAIVALGLCYVGKMAALSLIHGTFTETLQALK